MGCVASAKDSSMRARDFTRRLLSSRRHSFGPGLRRMHRFTASATTRLGRLSHERIHRATGRRDTALPARGMRRASLEYACRLRRFAPSHHGKPTTSSLEPGRARWFKWRRLRIVARAESHLAFAPVAGGGAYLAARSTIAAPHFRLVARVARGVPRFA